MEQYDIYIESEEHLLEQGPADMIGIVGFFSYHSIQNGYGTLSSLKSLSSV
jgi:hypothetical protein